MNKGKIIKVFFVCSLILLKIRKAFQPRRKLLVQKCSRQIIRHTDKTFILSDMQYYQQKFRTTQRSHLENLYVTEEELLIT